MLAEKKSTRRSGLVLQPDDWLTRRCGSALHVVPGPCLRGTSLALSLLSDDKVTTVSDISSAHYPSLFEALRLLPGIAPRQERDRLGKAKYQAAHSPSHSVDFSGVQLTQAQLEELFVHDPQGRPYVSRAGAALLLVLFDAGAFASVDGRKVEGNTELLGKYAKGLASVVAFNNRPRAQRKTRAASPPRQPGLAIAPARAVQISDVPSVIFRAHIHRLD